MTTEEFTGHLLAALHGPKADQIVDRIVVIAVEHLSDPSSEEGIAKSWADGFTKALATDDLTKMVFALALRALAVDKADQALAGRDSAAERMRRISQQIATGDTVRVLARRAYGPALKGDALEGLLDD